MATRTNVFRGEKRFIDVRPETVRFFKRYLLRYRTDSCHYYEGEYWRRKEEPDIVQPIFSGVIVPYYVLAAEEGIYLDHKKHVIQHRSHFRIPNKCIQNRSNVKCCAVSHMKIVEGSLPYDPYNIKLEEWELVEGSCKTSFRKMDAGRAQCMRRAYKANPCTDTINRLSEEYEISTGTIYMILQYKNHVSLIPKELHRYRYYLGLDAYKDKNFNPDNVVEYLEGKKLKLKMERRKIGKNIEKKPAKVEPEKDMQYYRKKEGYQKPSPKRTRTASEISYREAEWVRKLQREMAEGYELNQRGIADKLETSVEVVSGILTYKSHLPLKAADTMFSYGYATSVRWNDVAKREKRNPKYISKVLKLRLFYQRLISKWGHYKMEVIEEFLEKDESLKKYLEKVGITEEELESILLHTDYRVDNRQPYESLEELWKDIVEEVYSPFPNDLGKGIDFQSLDIQRLI
jgi:hypothetical protein